MKKIKLFLMVVALLCSAGLWAQASYNQSYTEGVTVDAGSEYFLYNIGAGEFLTGGMDWGSHASTDHAGKIITLATKSAGYSLYTAYYSTNGLENSGYLASNEYTDGSDDADWVFTPVSVDGYTNAYTVTNGAPGTDNYLYYVASNTRVKIGESTSDNYSYWILVPKSARDAVGDYTYYIQNAGINRFWERACWAECTWALNSTFGVGGNADNPCGEKYKATLDFYQNITAPAPNGKYTLYAQAFYRNESGSNAAPVLYANGSTNPVMLRTGDENNMAAASTSFSAGSYVNSVSTIVTNNSLGKIGINITANTQWVIWDNFALKYLGTCLINDAIAFTNGNTMTAGQWYYYDVETDGDYAFTAGNALDNIIYTTDGEMLTSEANALATTFSTETAFAAGRFYFKSTTEQTLAIAFVDPVIANGEYYLYDATNKVFLSRGADYGSRATVDKYGIPFTWNNYTKMIEFKDWTGVNLFFDKDNHTDCWLYTDGGSNKGNNRLFAFEEASEGYYYLCDKDKAAYITHDNIVLTVPSATSSGAAIWQVLSKAERDAIVNAYSTENKTDVITAASLTSETNAADFEEWLTINRAAKDKTSSIGTAKFTGSAGDWTWTAANGGGNATYGTDWTEAFQTAVGTWSQTISGLTKGIYKVTVNAFERAAGYAACNTLGASGWELVTAYFKANDEQIQLKSWYSDKEGTSNPNSTGEAATAFNNDKYKNELYTYVDDSGDLTITIGKPSKANGSWVLFNNVTLTFYDDVVSDEDASAILAEATTKMANPMKPSLYQALATAKSTFETLKNVPNYNALRTAIDNTETSIASYAAMKANYLDKIAAVLATTNVYSTSCDGYTEYMSYKDKYDNYTNAETEDIENATANALKPNTGTGYRYTSQYNSILATDWTINGTPATNNNSGFYVNTWSTENAGEAPAADFANPFYEYWVSSGSLTAATLQRTITNLLPNAAYSITANVRVQGSSKVAGSITMEVEGGAPVDVTAGSQIGETARYIGSYTATGVTDADGNLVLKINVTANSNISWLAFRDVNYATCDAAVSNDFAALNAAIGTKVIGFDEGEYAPYNNIEAAEALAQAKSIDQDRYYLTSLISETTTALTSAVWTVNTEELNAVYDGTFAAAENNGAPKGWRMSNNTLGGDYHSRAFVGDDRMKEFNETNSGLFLRFDGTNSNRGSMYFYGDTEGFSMPLKEGVTYYAKVDVAGWGSTGKPIRMNVTGPEGFSAQGQQVNTNVRADNADNAPQQLLIVFTATVAGNYVINFQTPGADTNTHNVVVSNIELKRAQSVDLAVSSALYGTFVAPFDVTIPSGVKAYTVDAAEGNTLTLTEKVTTIPANTPVVLESEAEVAATACYGYAVPVADPKAGLLTGTYTDIDAPNGSYVLQNQGGKVGFYLVDTNEATPKVRANRAYLTIANGGVKAFYFGDVETAIKSVMDGVAAGEVYDLSGRKVSKLQRGVNIVNGKKVIVK